MQGAQPEGPGLLTRRMEQGLPCPVRGTQLPEELNCVLMLKDRAGDAGSSKEGRIKKCPASGWSSLWTNSLLTIYDTMDTSPDFMQDEHHDANGLPFSEHDLLMAVSLSLRTKGRTHSS